MNYTEMYKEMTDSVRQFFGTFGYPSVETQRALIREEYNELLSGKNHLDSVADLCYVVMGLYVLDKNITMFEVASVEDILTYTTTLYVVPKPESVLRVLDVLAFGELRNLFNTVHKANMEKLWDEAPLVTKRGDKFVVKYRGKVIKPPGWVPPVLEL